MSISDVGDTEVHPRCASLSHKPQLINIIFVLIFTIEECDHSRVLPKPLNILVNVLLHYRSLIHDAISIIRLIQLRLIFQER